MSYFDRDGMPITLQRWVELSSDDDYRRVGLNQAGGVTVSTVWFGVGVAHHFTGRPLIFETLTHRGDFTECDLTRYATLAEAEAGHADAVKRAGGDEQ